MASLSIRIPQERQSGFNKLIELDAHSFADLLSALENSPVIYNADKLIDEIVSRITSIPEQDSLDIVASIIPLYLLLFDAEIEISEFAEEVCKAIERTLPGDTVLDAATREQLKQRLIAILGVKPVRAVLKATNLLVEHRHIFQGGRIITDLRPVFGEDAHNAPEAMIIAHMLRIQYLSDREYKEFFVTLDSVDLQQLIDVLERAKVKTQSLRTVLENAGISYMDAE